MIGFILLIIASASLVAPGCAQEDYDEVRPSRPSYRRFNDDNDAVVAKPAAPVVPILKQIDRHNDDGSYTYGFESADGSFKIETKQADGEVKGKYGYTDADGKLHVVEYGANKFGFQPSGEGIEVPPVNFNPEPEEEELPRRIQPKAQPRPQPRPAIQQQLQQWEQDAAPAPQPQPQPRPQPQYQPQPRPQPQPVRSQLRTQVVAPQPRPRPQAEPHIIYNSPSPTPKRPAFFAGAQAAPEPAQDISYDYEQSIPQRPAKQPVRAQTLAITKPQSSFFVPSSEFRQETQYSQQSPRYSQQAPQSVRPVTFNDDNSQFFRPESPKQAARQFAEPAPRAYTAPKATKPKGGGGFLDQLEEQFSLPSGGQPTHNIAFGFY